MMLGHYNEVVQDLKRREAANQPLDAQKQAAIAAGDAPSFGPKDAKVTIVEFSDFQCPYCGKAAEVVEKLRAKYSDRVRFVFRQFPLPMHPEAKVASQAALAAHEQGKFWQYHDLLFKNMRALDRASLEKYAKEVGLNMTQFKQALDSGKYADVVEADLKIGQDAAVQGTPTLFLNGARVQNAIDYDAVAAQIDAALAKG
jgi:protein-disulfide isomerase